MRAFARVQFIVGYNMTCVILRFTQFISDHTYNYLNKGRKINTKLIINVCSINSDIYTKIQYLCLSHKNGRVNNTCTCCSNYSNGFHQS